MKKLTCLIVLLFLTTLSFAQTPGGVPVVPIDNYVYALIGIALMLVAIVAFRKRQSKVA